ncbi:diacylglycerol kinase [Patescibacteria group bacterium]|nr:diacylglycerol kinase [Patescibacteria group bacterium]MBU1721890.1 diacylglycerol kinase [Patescibacteria group bacterium]MBU1900878.1 diacylglycerol kinase [Patescibacteria group bacterium]
MKKVLKSFLYAWEGIVYVFQHEYNFRLQLICAYIVIAGGIFVGMNRWEMIVVVAMSLAVLTLEILNTVFEKMLDVLRPRLVYQVKIVKDMLAAMVLMASIGAVVIGGILFWPYMFEFFW